jgi:hypothetical protein
MLFDWRSCLLVLLITVDILLDFDVIFRSQASASIASPVCEH